MSMDREYRRNKCDLLLFRWLSSLFFSLCSCFPSHDQDEESLQGKKQYLLLLQYIIRQEKIYLYRHTCANNNMKEIGQVILMKTWELTTLLH
jgi:hypothetical protein